MKIKLKSMSEVDFIEPIEWVKENNFQNASLLTGAKSLSEFSIYGWHPVRQIKFTKDGKVWDKIAQEVQKYDFSGLPYPANRCGWIGYLNYDLGRYLEALPDETSYSYRIPEAILALYNNYRYWDNKTQKCWEIVFEFPEFPSSSLNENKLPYKISNFTQECNEEEYCSKVKRIQDYILSGYVYEVNLTQQFSADFSGSPWSFFNHLYQKNSAPYSAYLNFPEFTICSISPEQFLSCDKRKVTTKPIKGTAPRGRNSEEDRVNQEMLMNSGKDLAELHMIVDLLRNDLSKVCKLGSVKVINPNKLETFANVFHLVGIVEGFLRDEVSLIELIKACFPGGSITGCPKIASMQVIEELETYKRNLYTGSIFVMNNVFLQSSIVIRTGIVVKGKLFVNSGGAITIESDPESEYQEILHKIRTFLDIKVSE
jgi:para-aminobenzoate synthetase component 1